MEGLKNLVRSAYYTVGGLPGMERAVRPWKGTGAILCYHRVLPEKDVASDRTPNKSLTVSLERFEEQIKYLSDNYKVVSMDEMTGRLRAGSRDFAVAVTFDDGYKDNYLYAYPILRKYNVPAIIYVTTRFLQGDTGMWWVELWERLLLSEHFSLEIRNERRTWQTEFARGKIKCFKEVRKILLESDRELYLSLLDQLPVDGIPRQYPERCLSVEEIRTIDREGLVTIGSHTHNHFCLSRLTEGEVIEEMVRAKKFLEDLLGKTVRHLAYPYGKRGEAEGREFFLARRCGYETGVTTINAGVSSSSDLFSLPRLDIRNHVKARGIHVLLSGFAGMLGRAL